MNNFYITHTDDQFLTNQISQTYANRSIILILFVFILLVCMTIKKKESVEEGFFSRDSTNTIRGIAIILLLLGHLNMKCVEGISFLEYAGNWAVVMFLFVSGIALVKTYGLSNLSIEFINKRVKRLAFPTWITLTLFIVLGHVLIHQQIHWKLLLLEYLGLIFPAPPDGPAWFVTYILFLYGLYFIVSKLKYRNSIKIIAMYVFCFYGSLLIHLFPNFPILSGLGIWRKYTYVMPTSILVALYSNKIMNTMRKMLGFPILYGSIVILFMLPMILGLDSNDRPLQLVNWFAINDEFRLVSSILFISSLTMIAYILDRMSKVSIFLLWLGKYSFEIFLIHFPFMAYYDFFLFRKPLFVFFFLYFISVLVLSIFLKIASRRLNLLVQKLVSNIRSAILFMV